MWKVVFPFIVITILSEIHEDSTSSIIFPMQERTKVNKKRTKRKGK